MKKVFSSIMIFLMILSVFSTFVPQVKAEPTPSQTPLEVSEKAATWIISQAIPEAGGYKWPIYQEPNVYYHSCFSAGGSGVGTFFLSLYSKTGKSIYLDYAKGAATWIISKAIPADGGYKWPHPDNDIPSGWYLTPQCSGASGIGEFLLKMYKVTGESTYLNYAKGAAQWMITNAEAESGGYFIPYNPPGKYGGQAAHGIQPAREAFTATFLLHLYEVTNDASYLTLVRDTATWLINRAISESGGYKWLCGYPYRSDYLIGGDGAAGIAMFFYELYEKLGDAIYLQYANGALQWVLSQAAVSGDTAKWTDRQGGTTYYLLHGSDSAPPQFSTISEMLLKGYSITSNPTYLDYAKKEANWIINQAVYEDGKYKFPTIEGDSSFDPFSNSIIYRFLCTMCSVTGDAKYSQYANGVLAWIIDRAEEENNGYKWFSGTRYIAVYGGGATGVGSNLLEAPVEGRVLFSDDFESYAVGTFPSPPWEFWFNTDGEITNATYVSPTKSLRLLGSWGWATHAVKRFSSSASVIGYEVYGKADGIGKPHASLGVSFQKWTSPTTATWVASVAFWYDGQIIVADGRRLQPYEPNRWYKIKALFNRDSNTYDVWIDDILKASSVPTGYADPYDIDGFAVGSDWAEVNCYFDNAKVFEGIAPPPVPPTLSAWALVTPTIDGAISPGEWDDSYSTSFLLTSQIGESHSATLWVKNDAQYLYLAVKVLNDDFNPGDGVFFNFDNDNDKSNEVGDDWLYVLGTGATVDGFLSVTPAYGRVWMPDENDGGTNDILGAAYHTNIGGNGDYSFELRHPLDTIDNAHDFSLKVNDRVGVELEFDDAFPGGAYSSPWPSFGTFATILIAAPPVAPDFEISVNPSSQTVVQGSSASATVTVSQIGGYGDSVSLSASGQPSGVTISFSPSSATPPFTSTMNVQAASNVPTGTYPITITGTGSDGKTHSATYTLTVVAPPPAFNFDISVSPSSQTLNPGQSTSFFITVTLTGGTTQTVQLSISGLHATMTYSFNPSSGNPTFTSTLTITTSSSTPTGTYQLTITGTGGGVTQTEMVTLVVVAPLIRNVAITSVTPSATTVMKGATVTISAIAKNLGTTWETFDVTCYADSIIIGIKTVGNLPPGSSVTLIFDWPTAGVEPKSYTIKVTATQLPDEIDIQDNVYIDGIVTVAPLPDLAVSKPRPVQVIWDCDLNHDGKIDIVSRKLTTILATITISGILKEQEVVEVKWTYDGLNFAYSYTVSELLARQGQIEFYFTAPELIGDHTIVVKVDPLNRIVESNENNNEKSVVITIKDTNGMYIVYIPVIHLGLLSEYSDTVSNSGVFIQATYPVAETEFVNIGLPVPYIPNPIMSYILWGHAGLLYDAVHLYTMGWLASLGKATDVVGVVPESYFAYHGVDSGTAGLNPPGHGAIFVKDGDWTTTAHELGHDRGLPVGYQEEYPPYGSYPTGRDAAGFWVSEGLKQVDINNDGKIGYIENGGCFMGGAAADPSSFIYYSGKPIWIDNQCYEQLFSVFKTSSDPEVVLITGIVFKNGTIQLGTWYRLEQGEVSYLSPGNYSVKLFDHEGNILVVTMFDAPFSMYVDHKGIIETDITSFAFSMPFNPNTTRIQLLYNGEVLAERIVTPNPPLVKVTYPNGGEILGRFAVHTITWESSDLDGDKLTYAVMYSADEGTTWQPLAIDLKDTRYIWNTSDLSTGSSYLIRVIASDDVNTGIDDSDNTFTILAKPSLETANAQIPPEPTPVYGFNPSDTVYVFGEGYEAGKTYPIYVVEDKVWNDGIAIPQRIAGTLENIQTNMDGKLLVLVGGEWKLQDVWNPPLIPGKYDIIIDINNNKIYDEGIDVLCDNNIQITAGFFVIPEVPLGILTILLLTLLSLALHKNIKSNSSNLHRWIKKSD